MAIGMVALVLLVLVLLGGFAGISYEVAQALKDTNVQGSVLTVKGTGEPVQTANSDMTVNADGGLSARGQGGDRRRGRRSASTDLPGIGRRSVSRRNDCSADGTCPLTTVHSASTKRRAESKHAYFLRAFVPARTRQI